MYYFTEQMKACIGGFVRCFSDRHGIFAEIEHLGIKYTRL